MSKFHQGKFQPRNPQKYKGDPNNIIYRSSWELKFLIECDKRDDIIEYSSEEIIIGYRSPKDQKIHRYFPDFLIKCKDKDENISTIMIEIKPLVQTVPPIKKKRITRGFINEIITYAVNQAKWEEAQKYCDKRGWKFMIMTERELGLIPNKS
jgi:hypothetical protein